MTAKSDQPSERDLRDLDRELRGRRPFLLLGEVPSEETTNNPELWLWPDSSGRSTTANLILAYSGLTREQYVRLFERDHLIHHARRRPHVGYTFDLVEARVGARRVVTECGMANRRLIVLGARPAAGFRAVKSWTHPWRFEDDLQPLQWSTFVAMDDAPSITENPDAIWHCRGAVVPSTSRSNNGWWRSQTNRYQAARFFSAVAESLRPNNGGPGQ